MRKCSNSATQHGVTVVEDSKQQNIEQITKHVTTAGSCPQKLTHTSLFISSPVELLSIAISKRG